MCSLPSQRLRTVNGLSSNAASRFAAGWPNGRKAHITLAERNGRSAPSVLKVGMRNFDVQLLETGKAKDKTMKQGRENTGRGDLWIFAPAHDVRYRFGQQGMKGPNRAQQQRSRNLFEQNEAQSIYQPNVDCVQEQIQPVISGWIGAILQYGIVEQVRQRR